MFAQTFVEGPARTSRGWTVVLSCCLQITIILLMVAVPLLRPEVLPRSVSTIVTIAPPPAPPPPPPPPTQPDRPRVRPRPSMVGGRIVYSPNPQRPLIDVVDPPLAGGSGVEGGVEGGVLGGPSSPLVNSIVKTAPPVAPPPTIVPAAAPKPEIVRINVGGRVQEALLINRVIPAYPPLAIQTRTSGVVRFTAVISREGVVTNLTLVSGHPLLVQAATSAVRQWRYKPTFLNGDPVEVVTTIDVNFVLGR
jgi:protein TonB